MGMSLDVGHYALYTIGCVVNINTLSTPFKAGALLAGWGCLCWWLLTGNRLPCLMYVSSTVSTSPLLCCYSAVRQAFPVTDNHLSILRAACIHLSYPLFPAKCAASVLAIPYILCNPRISSAPSPTGPGSDRHS